MPIGNAPSVKAYALKALGELRVVLVKKDGDAPVQVNLTVTGERESEGEAASIALQRDATTIRLGY